MSTAIQILSIDTVATAVEHITPGEAVQITGIHKGVNLQALEEIPSGHKIALRDIDKGEHILKYGEVIGAATEDIPAGHWVHIHNCRGVKARRFEK